MKRESLRKLTLDPKEKPDTLIIGLHGLGADGNDFKAIAQNLTLPSSWQVQMIFPHAPRIPVTINQKMVMPAWFDILKIDDEFEADKRSVDITHGQLLPILENAIQSGIKSERIILAGFSQGGSMALELALHFPKSLGAIVMLSSALLSPQKIIMKRFQKANARVPILFAHGKKDDVINVQLGKKSAQLLKKNNFDVTWKEYENMGHEVSFKELVDVSQWIGKALR